MYRIRNWNNLFENNRTRELQKMAWVPLPNQQDGDGYTELLDHPDGAAHFGAWVAIVQVASKCEPRGTLSRDIPQEGAGIPQSPAKPHDAASLARITRIPRSIFNEVIPRLISIGWIELTGNEINTPHEGAGIPHEGAASRARGNGMELNGMELKGTLNAATPLESVIPKPVKTPAGKRSAKTKGSPRFEQLWDFYDRKGSKADALKEWKRLDPSPDEDDELWDEILLGAQGMVDTRERQYRPDLERFIAKDKWQGKFVKPVSAEPENPYRAMFDNFVPSRDLPEDFGHGHDDEPEDPTQARIKAECRARAAALIASGEVVL